MTDQSTVDAELADPVESTSYAPYAQLAKMLVPSSGCIAIYDTLGDLIWCSDGFERPDLRELVDELKATQSQGSGNQGTVRKTASGVNAFTCVLRAENQQPLAFVLIELGGGSQGLVSGSMAPSLLRPVLECLASRIHLEQVVARRPRAADEPESPQQAQSLQPEQQARLEQVSPSTDDLELLLGLSNEEPVGQSGLQKLIEQCVENLGCVSGAFIVPDRSLNIVVNRAAAPDQRANQFLDRTQKHLLAWVQLNNRPMIVNRVGDDPKMAPYKILSCPVRDANQQVAGLVALFRGADEANFEIRDVRILDFVSRRAIRILRNQHDALTGLTNRLVFERQVQAALAEHADQEQGVLLYIDIDRLQYINDAFGFDAGDEVIQRLAELVRARLTANDIASRIAGDRFAVYLTAKTESQASALAHELLEAMSQLGYLKGSEAVPVSISVGLASAGPDLKDVRHLLAAAELACKRAQQQGRDRLEVYARSERLSPAKQQELFAAASLQQALQSNEFRLLAQPIVGLVTEPGRTLGFEVLVRMRDAGGTLLSPEKFLLAAERYGLMPAVDKWVFASVAEELKNRIDDVRELPLGIAINVSGQSLLNGGYADYVIEQMTRHGLPGELFSFELRESAAVHHLQEAERFIERLTTAKCRVALDDFGAGLTSLAHLKRLKVDYLKIDGSLVRRVLDDIHVESMVLGLTKAARTLGVSTVAEHVESEVLAAKLGQMEIDFAQGYCYGHPKPFARALAASVKAVPLLKAGQS